MTNNKRFWVEILINTNKRTRRFFKTLQGMNFYIMDVAPNRGITVLDFGTK